VQTNVTNRLASYVEALRSIIYVHHFDFVAVEALIQEIAGDTEVFEYSEAGGWLDFRTKQQRVDCDLAGFLALIDEEPAQNAFVVIKDAHLHLAQPKVLARLRSLATKNLYQERFNCTVFLMSNTLTIPDELEGFITVFELPHPGVAEIRAIIREFGEAQQIKILDEVADELALSFKGFSNFEIIQMLNLAYQNSGGIEHKDKQIILREKEQIIKKSGMLEIISFDETMDDIGGLENLKVWLAKKAHIFRQLDQALKFGVDVPKGVVIVGMPGCGKSLTAKAAANLFEVPLLRLDVGKLLGKYVGDSESNMRRTLKIAEAVSPCVLWVDEIEKAFAGVGEGGGHEVTTRLFGYFLTWVQEKESSVFIIATANDISKLPPEFLRKGRFDELFFVDLPNPEERRKIFEIHLKKRQKWHSGIDTIQLLKATDGFSGADIEAVVKEDIENAFIQQTPVTTESLLAVANQTKSLSKTLKEKIDSIKKSLEKIDVKPASGAGSAQTSSAVAPGEPESAADAERWYGPMVVPQFFPLALPDEESAPRPFELADSEDVRNAAIQGVVSAIAKSATSKQTPGAAKKTKLEKKLSDTITQNPLNRTLTNGMFSYWGK
jgi:ATP-dependent 26S proteasome regulatory subunit